MNQWHFLAIYQSMHCCGCHQIYHRLPQVSNYRHHITAEGFIWAVSYKLWGSWAHGGQRCKNIGILNLVLASFFAGIWENIELNCKKNLPCWLSSCKAEFVLKKKECTEVLVLAPKSVPILFQLQQVCRGALPSSILWWSHILQVCPSLHFGVACLLQLCPSEPFSSMLWCRLWCPTHFWE